MNRFLLILLFAGFVSMLNAQVKDVEYLFPEDWHNEYLSKVHAIIVDTRTNKEFKKKRIEASINVPAMTNLIPFADSLDRETPLFLYCDDESRSNTVAIWLNENEFTSLYILKGGFIDWKAMGMKVEKRRPKKVKRRKA